MPVITQRQPQEILWLGVQYLYSNSNTDCIPPARGVHHPYHPLTYVSVYLCLGWTKQCGCIRPAVIHRKRGTLHATHTTPSRQWCTRRTPAEWREATADAEGSWDEINVVRWSCEILWFCKLGLRAFLFQTTLGLQYINTVYLRHELCRLCHIVLLLCN